MKDMVNRMRASHQGRVVRNITRPSPDHVKTISAAYTGIVLDHLGKATAAAGILPLQHGMRLCGPAVTCLGGDLTVRRAAIDLAASGDVLVVAAGGDAKTACFGDGTATRMRLKGMTGAVIDGATRDAAGLRQMRFPTFSLGVTAKNYHYPIGPSHGAVNVPVVCGGVVIRPGDVVLGDDDGVVVVPLEDVARVASDVAHALEKERRERASLCVYESFGALEELVLRGYECE